MNKIKYQKILIKIQNYKYRMKEKVIKRKNYKKKNN